MEMIKAKGLVCTYQQQGSHRRSLDDVSFTVNKGELLFILGGSGCGKTSLALTLNGLLPLEQGELSIAGMDCRDADMLHAIRRNCGLIFEDVEDMFVSTYVEEDVAFAARNFNIDPAEIGRRVRGALDEVGLRGYEDRPIRFLTALEKQLLAIAGVLVYDPDILIFDSLGWQLDAQGRMKLLNMVRALHNKGKTLVVTSENAQDAVFADKVLIMSEGKLLSQGSPRDILADAELLSMAGLELPFAVRVYHDLIDSGVKLDKCPLDIDELVEEICR